MNTSANRPATIITSEVVALIPWTDRRTDFFGYDPRSAYVEQFWLASLGPSTTWFLRYCADLLEGTDATAISLRETASALGIGYEGGLRSAMAKTVVRACRFRAARPVGTSTLAVRMRLPQLSLRQLHRLPEGLQRRHEAVIAGKADPDALSRHRARARQLASSLIMCGDNLSETETQLSRLWFHPVIAAEAARWAWNQHHSQADTNPPPLDAA